MAIQAYGIVRIDGVREVVQALRRKTKMTADEIHGNLIRAGLFIQRESMLLCPVDTGNLRAGAFTRAKGEGFNTQVTVGYTANYAVYVHENLTNRHNPPTQAKFLEQPMRDHQAQIFEIIKGGIIL
jgi:hypothetical protein